MKIIRLLLYLILILVGAFALFLLYATIDDYRPDSKINQFTEEQAPVLPDSAELDLLIWNLGYAGLDASMDFFYDGGKQMRPSKEGVIRNLKGITSFLASYTDYDFILLQEVDLDSKRSYHLNQFQEIGETFPGYSTFFGMNYNVFFVPIPLSEPMGKVESGLMTLTRHTPSAVDRYGFPGNYSWPMKLFMLDRCFLVERHPVSSGKELVIINTHNSAYDDGSLRMRQMAFMKDFLLAEYNRGNYIIVGGDWNQTPFGLKPELPSHQFDTLNLTLIEEDYPAPGWTWGFDPGLPTNRRVTVPYDRSTSLTTIIDCYLLSPNIQLEEVKTIDVDFQFSDHQPVQLSARLKATQNENRFP
jgi:endonuclease/exonuclease/phosphatase family metal-dependent hydrolase